MSHVTPRSNVSDTRAGSASRGRGAAGALAAAMLALAPAAWAAPPADPAAARVDAFDDALLRAMKMSGGVKARDRELTPAVESAFDLPIMTRYAVGLGWAAMTDAQHADLVRAFERYTTANYAHNFDAYSGQKFEIQSVQTRGVDKIVQAQLVSPHAAPVALMYRLHETAAGWKIIDVYYNGISQLTTRRADFASSATGGAAGLLSHLDDLTGKLLS
jgi:phospholipid transport system substrate-binding protein